jgi:cell division protein FtsB
MLAFWMMFLTGILNDVTGSPGALQAIRLRSMLSSKNTELTDLEGQIRKLDGERHRLEESTAHQEREIRRVLGYAAPGEIIFDFSRGLLQK